MAFREPCQNEYYKTSTKPQDGYLKDADYNTPFGFDWAFEADGLFKRLIIENRSEELADYRNLGAAVRRAAPTPEHYLPMLCSLALREDNEPLAFFNDTAVAGSITIKGIGEILIVHC